MLLHALLSCKGDIFPEDGENIVVEGWIEDGGFPVVVLTTSLALSEDYAGADSLRRHMLTWAKVTISDGTDEVILTGMYDSLYFPPYIYTTGNMLGKAGHTYRLKVEYEDYTATAVTTIPESVKLDSVSVARCAESDTLYQLTAHFTDNPDSHNYYLLFVNNGLKYNQPMITYMGYLDDQLTTSNHISAPIYKEQSLQTVQDYIPYFTRKDTVVVKLAHAGAEAFNFWSDVQNSVSFSTSMYMPITSNVRSNITGGIGYWFGYGVSVQTVVMADRVKRLSSQ